MTQPNPENTPVTSQTQDPNRVARGRNLARIGLSVALGGFLMGFDASVISGVVRFIRPEFGLTDLQLGWAVSSLTLTATLAMLTAGPLSDRVGRRAVLMLAAALYAVSAIASALATDFATFVAARMIGGLGVGASLIMAPMYLAEIAPPHMRGRLVSLNQLNIVIGISVAFFSNYLILKLAGMEAVWIEAIGLNSDAWRWMLAIEIAPAALFFVVLFFIPQSPRWLVMQERDQEASDTLLQIFEPNEVVSQMAEIKASLGSGEQRRTPPLSALIHPSLRWVLLIGLLLAVLQQITGINAVFFYAPMIFEQSGLAADAAFLQAALVGLTNLIFTVFAMLLIDRIGRRPLLVAGMAGIALSMAVLTYAFNEARYELSNDTIQPLNLPSDVTSALTTASPLVFESDTELRQALSHILGDAQAKTHVADVLKATIRINSTWVLVGILAFIASFAISIGPVMWVMLSELFPLKVRGLAVSLAGFVNSGVSFGVQLMFPVQLSLLGASQTFLIYGLFAFAGLLFILKWVPETRQKSLEQLSAELTQQKF